MKNNVVKNKSFDFALRVVKLYKYLTAEKKEHVLSKQLLRSGTSVGAMVREAEHAESKADFIHKLSIALKEANESFGYAESTFYERRNAPAFIGLNYYTSLNISMTEVLNQYRLIYRKS